MASSLPDPTKALIASRLHYLDSSSCGYCDCKKERSGGLKSFPENADAPDESTHITIGCQVEQMTCQQYDDFINRGFRRSGTFMYTGDMLRGCCRAYTIRTDMDHLKITKEHRQVVNRFKRAIGCESKTKSKFELSSLIEAEKKSTRFHTRFEPSGYSKEKYELYKKYQIEVHNDNPAEVTPKQFKRFLCETPFPEVEVAGKPADWDRLNNWIANWGKDSTPHKKRIGPTHECYYLDDKLIAISILDFLPTGLSSIYFIWDPDYAHMSLGTLSGIREIQMCKELGLGYYYLGYYIDDCPKMRYKAKFGGEVLDLLNGAWIDLEKARPLMAEDTYFTLGESATTNEEPSLSLEKDRQRWQGSVTDISQELYGKDEVYDKADQILRSIKTTHDVDDFELPHVLPGALPMPILQKTIDSVPDLEVTLFVMTMGRWGSFEFSDLTPTIKSYVVDFIRLFGLQRLKETILIV